MLVLIAVLLGFIFLAILFPNFVKLIFWGVLFLLSLAFLFLSTHAGAQDYRPVHFSAPNEQEVYDLLMHANVAYFGYRCKVSEGKYGDDILSYALRLSNETGVDGRVFASIHSLSSWQFTAAYPEMDDDTPGSSACLSLPANPAFHQMMLIHEKITR